jgi:hypothetical protein
LRRFSPAQAGQPETWALSMTIVLVSILIFVMTLGASLLGLYVHKLL